ncbi:MAG: hypothetical protein ACFFF4_11735 [Candidatus Thorarchaeota archaeon]
MRKRLIYLCAGFSMFVLSLSLYTSTPSATLEGEWSDDFNDGNIDGWSVQGFSTSTYPWQSRPGNITAEDKTMRVYSDAWSQAYRPSNVAYGSWAFDVQCVDTPNMRSYIAFVSGSPVLNPAYLHTMPFEYGIITAVGQYESYDSAFVLYQRPADSPYLVTLGGYDVEEVSGWYHINITRYIDGTFAVYFNDTLGITVRDSNHTTSDLFTFYAEAGYALDNIVVVPQELEPPTTSLPLSWEIVVIGGSVAVVVMVVVIYFLRRR